MIILSPETDTHKFTIMFSDFRMDAIIPVMDSSKSSHCLVTGFMTVKKRSAIAMDAAMRFDNVITCSCSSNGINIFTNNTIWKKRLIDSNMFTISGQNSFTSTIIYSYKDFMDFIVDRYDDIPRTICVTVMNNAYLHDLFTDVFVYVNNRIVAQIIDK